MPVPASLASLSTTAASNSPSGGENPFPDLDNHLRAHSAFLALLRDNGHQYLSTVGGTVDVITGSTVSASPTSYSAGQVYWFKSAGANTSTTPTININAIGAKTIVRQDGSALVAGDIASGKMIELYYDGTNMVFNNCPRVPKADLATTANSATTATTATSAASLSTTVTAASDSSFSNNSVNNPSTDWVRGYTQSRFYVVAAVATTSGTSVDLTGIPSWAKRITVLMRGVSVSGASILVLQPGAGSPTTSGYTDSVTGTSYGTSGGANSTSNGFPVFNNNASNAISGAVVLYSMGSNVWIASGSLGSVASPVIGITTSGSIALGGTLDRIRLTTTGGTDTFDAGSIGLFVEG